MATGPAWLFLALKVDGHDSDYIQKKLFPATTVGSQPSLGRATRRTTKAIGDLLAGTASGTFGGNLFATVLDNAGTLAAGSIACTQLNAAGNYVRWTYGALTVTLTEGTDFAAGASDTTCATNLAAAINAHDLLSGLYTATSSTGTVTVTAKLPTQLIEDVAMSTDDATAFALTQVTGGTEGAAKIFLQQFWANRGK